MLNITRILFGLSLTLFFPSVSRHIVYTQNEAFIFHQQISLPDMKMSPLYTVVKYVFSISSQFQLGLTSSPFTFTHKPQRLFLPHPVWLMIWFKSHRMTMQHISGTVPGVRAISVFPWLSVEQEWSSISECRSCKGAGSHPKGRGLCKYLQWNSSHFFFLIMRTQQREPAYN